MGILWSLGILRTARRVARFNPSRRLAELLGNFAQKLRRALFRFRRNLFFHKTFHPREFFVNALPEFLEVIDALEPCDFVVDAFAELFESVHSCPSLSH